MTWFMGLDTLPAGTHMYTAYLVCDGEPGDEIDFTAPSYATTEELEAAVKAHEDWELYDPRTTSICGIADQSDGEIILDRREEMGLV